MQTISNDTEFLEALNIAVSFKDSKSIAVDDLSEAFNLISKCRGDLADKILYREPLYLTPNEFFLLEAMEWRLESECGKTVELDATSTELNREIINYADRISMPVKRQPDDKRIYLGESIGSVGKPEMAAAITVGIVAGFVLGICGIKLREDIENGTFPANKAILQQQHRNR